MSEVIVAFLDRNRKYSRNGQEYCCEKGIKEGGAEGKSCSVDDISAADLKDAKAFALGCPSMGVEQLEESTMEPFVEEVCGFASGKTIGLFGSYGWGRRRMDEKLGRADGRSRSKLLFGGEDAICQEAPDEDAQDELKAMGKQLAAI